MLESSPSSTPSYHTAPQTQQPIASSSSTGLRDEVLSPSTSSPVKPAVFPRANLKPTTSVSIHSPPTPARTPSLEEPVPSHHAPTSQMLPPSSSQPQSQAAPTGTQIRRTAAEIQANKEEAQRRVSYSGSSRSTPMIILLFLR